jgi:RNA polymerase-binding transcription factor
LLRLARQLARRIGREIETARETADDQADSGDLSLIDELREEHFFLADNDSAVLKLVQAALLRIEDGTFGQCAVDGGPIGEKRLEAVPWTPYCVTHQQQLEEQAGIRTPKL